MVSQRKGDVVADAEVRNQCPVLENETDLPLGDFKSSLPFRGDVLAEIVQSPGAGTGDAGNHAQKGALSLTRRPADAKRLAALQHEVCVRNDFLVVVAALVEERQSAGLRKSRARKTFKGKV